MEKILVPTDFSDNSKPAIRFAIRLAARTKASLVFINILQVKRPFPSVSKKDSDFDAIKEEQVKKTIIKLNAFVNKIHNLLNLEAQDYSCEVIEGIKADVCLIDYCKTHPEIKLLVISTRGASFLNKTLGTNTGNLITKSPVPIIAVPKDYRYKPLRNVLYASDLANLDAEFKKVLDFAKPRGLTVELLHFSTLSKKEHAAALDKENLEAQAGYPLTIRIEENDVSYPMSKNLKEQIKEIQPSLLILFTNQDRTFFEKLFLSSMAEDLSFKIQTPMLVFKK